MMGRSETIDHLRCDPGKTRGENTAGEMLRRDSVMKLLLCVGFSLLFVGAAQATPFERIDSTANIQSVDQNYGLVDWKDLLLDDPGASSSATTANGNFLYGISQTTAPYNYYAVIKNSNFAETNWANIEQRTAYSYFDTLMNETRYWAVESYSGTFYKLTRQSADSNIRMLVGSETLIPEPTTAVLVGLGLIGLGMRRRS